MHTHTHTASEAQGSGRVQTPTRGDQQAAAGTGLCVAKDTPPDEFIVYLLYCIEQYMKNYLQATISSHAIPFAREPGDETEEESLGMRLH